MRESCTYGSARGALSNERPYRYRRREFITLLGGAAAALPLTVRAQQSNIPVIGWLHAGAHDESAVSSFGLGLREVGFTEGQNVAIEYRWAENQEDRMPALAADLARHRVAVIAAASGLQAVASAKAATLSIPIVFLSGADPVRIGLVSSLNRPGGNITGISQFSVQLTDKRLGLLHDLSPQVSSVAVLLDGRGGGPKVSGRALGQKFILQEQEMAGSRIGLRTVGAWVGDDENFDEAFGSAIHEGTHALLVASSTFFFDHRDLVVALAAKHRLPAIYDGREYATAGGLMSYGASRTEGYRQFGVYTGRVLKGEKPADLPVLQPTKFEFVINLKTAEALGIAVPVSLLVRADEVIE
jgi:putative ABC transport system substrate-binding protein